jgi:hypothetical protein
MRCLRIMTAITTFTLCGAGCAEVLHNFKPHRLQRLNRYPSPYRDDPEMSSTRRVYEPIDGASAGPAPASEVSAAGSQRLVSRKAPDR